MEDCLDLYKWYKQICREMEKRNIMFDYECPDFDIKREPTTRERGIYVRYDPEECYSIATYMITTVMLSERIWIYTLALGRYARKLEERIEAQFSKEDIKKDVFLLIVKKCREKCEYWWYECECLDEKLKMLEKIMRKRGILPLPELMTLQKRKRLWMEMLLGMERNYDMPIFVLPWHVQRVPRRETCAQP